ncbi:LysR family transcriptional regulator [Advenella alkanexedens]|uniref:LysR family transcriptional regulator n=1 Tax=Advenella alkanexedens TaxID=1481665 RepID=UPI002676B1AD|nr:LysR family transcriptional regulator [Advenella alkanexedens]WKU20047.1 LysR family transcriptional regulator [Advenella alkanexedens]
MDRLKAMEYFLSVSRSRNFTETARQFAVSATSVSRLITDLEKELNVKLLLRSTRQVMLTEAGQEYAHQLEGILWSINHAHNSITAISSSPQGLLRVHSRVMFGIGVLTPLIARFRTLYPDIKIELLLSETYADLRQQQIDIDFRISPPVEAGLKRRILFKSERYLVASPDYIATMPELSTPAQLNNHACLCYQKPGERYICWYLSDKGTEEASLNPRHISNNGIALLELARLGEGIALLDDYTVANDIAQGKLVRLLPEFRVTNSSFEDGIYATIQDSPIIPAKIRAFLDFVAEEVSGHERRFLAYRQLRS